MAKYTLVGVDGNAYSVMGYVARAMQREGLREEVSKMHDEAKSGDYNHLLVVCMDYLDKANKKAEENGYIKEEDDQ